MTGAATVTKPMADAMYAKLIELQPLITDFMDEAEIRSILAAVFEVGAAIAAQAGGNGVVIRES